MCRLDTIRAKQQGVSVKAYKQLYAPRVYKPDPRFEFRAKEENGRHVWRTYFTPYPGETYPCTDIQPSGVLENVEAELTAWLNEKRPMQRERSKFVYV